MKQKKHGLKVKKFTFLPTGEYNDKQNCKGSVYASFLGIIRRFIFALECFLKLMSYLTYSTQPRNQKDRIKSNTYFIDNFFTSVVCKESPHSTKRQSEKNMKNQVMK